MDAIGAHAVEVMAALTDAGIHTHVAHAYTPNEAGSYGGSDHIVIDAGYVRNRMVGDALCKPAKKFWQLLRSDTGSPSCKTCIERAEKLVTQLVKQKIARDLRAEDEP
jgi:dihydroxyacetone kinase